MICSLKLVDPECAPMSRRGGHREAWLPWPARRMRPSTASWKARFQRRPTSGRSTATGRPSAVVHRAVDRGEIPAATDAAAVIQTVTAQP
jgi:hypothetical protein